MGKEESEVMAKKRKAGKNYEARCMAFAEQCLDETKSKTQAVRDAKLGNGNYESERKLASRMSTKTEQVLENCKVFSQQELNINHKAVVMQYIELLNDPKATVKDKITIWDKVAGLLGLNRIITENKTELTVAQEIAELVDDLISECG